MINEQSRITITREQKEIIAQGIIDGTLKLMQKTIARRSPRKAGREHSKPYKQSRSALTSDSIYFNILTNGQRLPARPRDFRINLAEEEKDIGKSELSDILVSLVRRYLLDPKRDNFHLPRGRPVLDTKKSGISREKRGRLSPYDRPRIKQVIEAVLDDDQCLNKIDNAVINSKLFYLYQKYSFEADLYQMKENEYAFQNSLKPAIRKYGLRQLQPGDSNKSWIASKDLTDNDIKRIAEYRAATTTTGKDGKNILYTTGGIIFFDQLLRTQ